MKLSFQRVKKLPKKIIIIGLIALVISGFFIFPKGNQQTLEFYTVKKQDIKSTVSASGSLSGKTSIDLKFRNSGKIASINVKTSDKVYQGQVLASLDNTIQVITLQQAQNTLRDKQAIVDKILDDIHLFQYGMGGFSNVGSLNETMLQRQLRTSTEVARDNAFDQVKLAQKAFEDTIIVAPAPGIITQANFVVGQQVGAQDLIFKMIDSSETFFDAEVDEADFGKVTIAQKAEVTLDAYSDKVIEGEVSEIIPQVETTSSGATIVTVRIILGDPDISFINGLSGQAAVILSESKDVLTIPVEALREDDTVILQTSQGLEPKKVVTGIESDTDVEIKEGLNEGDNILLNPPQLLQNRRGGNPLFRFFGGARRG